MFKLSGTIVLSVLTLSIAEPPVNSYLPPNDSPAEGTWSGYQSSLETQTTLGNTNYERPTGSHGNQGRTSSYSNSQALLNPQQYSSFSQRPSQYRLSSHGPRSSSTYTPKNDDFQNPPILSSYGPPNSQHQNNNIQNSGNAFSQQTSLSYLPPQIQKPSSNQINLNGPPSAPAYESQPGNHFNSPMNSYIPPNNFGSEHGNAPNCKPKRPISNAYGPPNFMNNKPSSSYGPPQSANIPVYRPPSNTYLPANSEPQTPEFPSSFPQYPNQEADQDQNSSPPANSLIPSNEGNRPSPPSSFNESPPPQELKPERTEAPPLIKSRYSQEPSNSYPTSFKNVPNFSNSQYPSQKSAPIIVPNTYPTFGQENVPEYNNNHDQQRKNANFESQNTYSYMANPGYQPEFRQHRLRQGPTLASEERNQASTKGFNSQIKEREDGPSERNSYPDRRKPIKKSAHGPNKGYSYSDSNDDNLLQANQQATGYSYEAPASPPGQGPVKDETGYRY